MSVIDHPCDIPHSWHSRDIERALNTWKPDQDTVDRHTRFIMGLALRELLTSGVHYHQVVKNWGPPGIFSVAGGRLRSFSIALVIDVQLICWNEEP